MPTLKKVYTLEISPEQFLNNCSPNELKEIHMLLQGFHFSQRMNAGMCRVCGCTDYDCSQCIERTGEPCFWFEPDLCSACANTTKKIEE